MTHSLRIRDNTFNTFKTLLCNKEAHIRIFSFKTTHLLYMDVILLKTIYWISFLQNFKYKAY